MQHLPFGRASRPHFITICFIKQNLNGKAVNRNKFWWGVSIIEKDTIYCGNKALFFV